MITSLAYIGITTPAASQWRPFATGILGCMAAPDGPDGSIRLRVDEADWRIQIHPGDADDLSYIGWSVAREEDLDSLVAALADAGVAAGRGQPDLAEARGVDQLITFEDPWGFRHEVIWGQRISPVGFQPGRPLSGFVTGQQGLGHVVLLLPDVEKGHEFFSGVLGFEMSDKIITDRLNTRFYHCNRRHHSLALGQAPGAVGFNHLMLQVKDLDDVGTAYDLCRQRQVPITMELGRHTNDLMTSFYVRTPSQFHIEYGWGAVEVDGSTWVPQRYQTMSVWGHHFTAGPEGHTPGIMRSAQ